MTDCAIKIENVCGSNDNNFRNNISKNVNRCFSVAQLKERFECNLNEKPNNLFIK